MTEITPRLKKILAKKAVFIMSKSEGHYTAMVNGKLAKLTYDDVIRMCA